MEIQILLLFSEKNLRHGEDLYDFPCYMKENLDREFRTFCSLSIHPLFEDVKINIDFVEECFQDSKYMIIIVCEELEQMNKFCRWLSSYLEDRSILKSRLLYVCLGDVKIDTSYPTINMPLDYRSVDNYGVWMTLLSKISVSSTSGGPSGLINTKETSYMNSMIQALASSIKLLKLMCSQTHNDSLDILTKCLKGINENKDICQNTENLVTFMNTAKWNRSRQQDAFQLLSFFINSVKIEENTKKTTTPPKFKILHTFTEDSKYNKVQDHLALALPLCGTFKDLPGVPLHRLMDEFFNPSIIDDGPYATQLYLFEEAPAVMILHIQANVWSDDRGEYIKPKYYIKYEEQLKYTFKIQKKVDASEEVSAEVTYQLMAVVNHMGSISGGHYITYRRHGQRWYLTNDEQVEEVNFKCDVVPYVMVYENIVEH